MKLIDGLRCGVAQCGRFAEATVNACERFAEGVVNATVKGAKVAVAMIATLAVGAASVASAQAPAPTTTITDIGVDMISFATNFGLKVGVVIASGVALAFAIGVVSIAVRWIFSGGKKR